MDKFMFYYTILSIMFKFMHLMTDISINEQIYAFMKLEILKYISYSYNY